MLFSMTACSSGENADTEGKALVYRINNAETKTESYFVPASGNTTEEYVDMLLSALSEKSQDAQYKAPLSMGFDCLGYSLEDGIVTLDMSPEYKTLNFTTEVLVRAAIVRTLCGCAEIDGVVFTVEGEPLMDHSGFEVGKMTADTFISNDGNEINTYEEVSVTLYFASADGANLISVNREKFYPTSVPLERFVVEELLKGPQIENIYPSVNPSVSIVSISTKDEVCYVNLSSDILVPYGNVPTQTSVYAIVNSLCKLPSVKKVQILVDGVVPDLLENSYEADESMVISLE